MSARDYFLLMRPFTLLAPFIGFVSSSIIALTYYNSDPFSVFIVPQLSDLSIFIMILFGGLSGSLLNGWSNVVNQIFDIEVDKINKPFRPLPNNRISVLSAKIFAIILVASALIIAISLNFIVFIIEFATACITFFYSAPPLRFKSRGILSNISIAIPRGLLLIVAGWSIFGEYTNPIPWFIGSIFGLYILGAASTKDFADIEGDKKFNINTLPVKYGAVTTAKIISPFFIFPFLLIPFGVYFQILTFSTIVLTFLSVWGAYTAHLILKKPEDLTIESNHASWKHMYLILIFGQFGFMIAYFF
ncbi:MAG: UbiA family prenyltransferase [Candidatus Helarchaeota archaeon]